jgi:hypothetical protein
MHVTGWFVAGCLGRIYLSPLFLLVVGRESEEYLVQRTCNRVVVAYVNNMKYIPVTTGPCLS